MRDIKYIFKRILIGVGIALVLSFLKGGLILNAHALEVSNYGIGGVDTVVSNTTQYFEKTISGNPWATFAGMSGYVTGSFSMQKVNGTPTSINVFPTQIFISTNTGYQDYVCDIGSAMEGNSTFNGGSFTYRCPIKMGTSGVTRLVFQFQNIQTNYPSEYRLSIGSSMSFEVVENTNVNVDTSGTTNAINNQTQSNNHNRDANFGNLIQDNRNNTQAIINNQNSNTQQQIESERVCVSKTLFYNDTDKGGHWLGSQGGYVNVNGWGITDYIELGGTSFSLFSTYTNNAYFCYYNQNKELISCNGSANGNYLIPNGVKFARFSIRSTNQPQVVVDICRNGNQAIVDSQQDINNTLNDSNVSSATSDASSFFGNFSSNSHGLSGIITAPLRLINSFTTATCSPLEFNLPFVGNHVTLPCMRPIYENYFGIFFSLWQLITTGLISYNICINLYGKIRNLQNPNNDRIEVLNL